MSKLKKIENTNGQYLFYCPGCKEYHGIWTAQEKGGNPVWNWNGDINNPTVSPSIRVTIPNKKVMGVDYICHSFIRDGKIQYLSDCTHELAGKTVDMVDIDLKDNSWTVEKCKCKDKEQNLFGNEQK